MNRLRRRALPAVLLAVLVVAVALLHDHAEALLVLLGVLLATLLALAVELWLRQGEQLRRADGVARAADRVALELGGLALGSTEEDRRRTVHGQLRLLDTRTKSLDTRTREIARAQEAMSRQQEEAARDAARAAHNREVTRRRDHRNDFAQVEALLNLYSRFPPQARMPALRGWAVSPDLLLAVVEMVLQRRPRTILELGGGSSTLWLAHVLRSTGTPGRIVTLEHDEFWQRKVGALLDAHGLADRAEVRLAPLTEHAIDGETWRWYDRSAWEDLADLDLVLVDGPPATTGPLARYPAVPLLRDRLGEEAVIVMDDTIRTDEQQVAERWAPMLEGYARLELPVEKQSIVFHRGAAPAL